jgi:hypothetical protein
MQTQSGGAPRLCHERQIDHSGQVDEVLRDAFLRDVAASVRLWEQWGRQELDRRSDADTVLQEAVQGVVHSVLVSIDGGTALSDSGRKVWLTDATGSPIAEGLHEYLFDHLPDGVDAPACGDSGAASPAEDGAGDAARKAAMAPPKPAPLDPLELNSAGHALSTCSEQLSCLRTWLSLDPPCSTGASPSSGVGSA